MKVFTILTVLQSIMDIVGKFEGKKIDGEEITRLRTMLQTVIEHNHFLTAEVITFLIAVKKGEQNEKDVFDSAVNFYGRMSKYLEEQD